MRLDDKKLKLTKNQLEAVTLLGLHDVEDLLSYYPFRYEILNIKPFVEWKEKDKVTFEARVISAPRSFRFGRSRTRSVFEVMCEEEYLIVTIFNRPWISSQLHTDDVVTITGTYAGNNKVTAMNYQAHALAEIPFITPVYSTRSNIKEKTIHNAITKAFQFVDTEVTSYLPDTKIKEYHLLTKKDALYKIHFPKSEQDLASAYRTLKYEEFLKFFLTVQLLKSETDDGIQKVPKNIDEVRVNEFINSIPFTPTKDQFTAIQDILKDLESPKVMYRLVQGDVGCGKTFVAMASMYACALSGYQCALLAPTEILAKQHYESMSILKKYGIRIEVLYSGQKTQEKNDILDRLEKNEIDILIGTHSILEKKVKFARLGFVVVDEQQRFGVNQRKALKEKGNFTDFLLMSATPIPRTLANTLYGDMDVSTIETMPSGRKPVITKLIEENSFRSVLPEINALLDSGHQLYVICAAVSETELLPARNVEEQGEVLKKLFAQKAEVGILHGRMSSEEKESIMQAFNENKIQILVSTTVVEVGMNVVNATGMIIYDADRFGLSQLHQLRGRVQRGDEQGQCYLLTHSKDEKTLERLCVLVNTTNGFEISYEDLRLRGPGDILGTRQSGIPDFVLGNLVQDHKIVETARKDALEIIEHNDEDENKNLLEKIKLRNSENISYYD